jgi:predicted pyridoxine 5'-phosphate oxidase superfamily flavin-nucleotide-binding protein
MVLTEEMKRVVHEQRLGFVATVCPDGTPNLSPKGTTTVWDDEHLIFADIRSPRTVANLRHNPSVEVNVVDPVSRKGFRFKGTAEVIGGGERLAEMVEFYRRRGVVSPINVVVLIKVERAAPLISPVYDLGLTEEEVRKRWQR